MSQSNLIPPPLQNDCFALPPGVNWTPVADAQSLLQERLHTVAAVEQIPMQRALGRVLAASVLANRSNPPKPNSAVDGYAVRGSEFGEGDHLVPLIDGRSAAGQPFDGRVPSGQALRILTGATMPEGADTVVLQEDVSLGEGEIAFRGPLKVGANARLAGEDFREYEVIFTSGHRIRPADMALLAAAGVQTLDVFKPLRVAVLSTGDELAEAGSPAGPNQIFDANRPMLLSMISKQGHVAIDLGRIADKRDKLRKALDKAAIEADLILTSGGASAGDEDHMSALLNEAGAMALWRLAIKPGRPLALGLWQNTPVFGLPGNPVAAGVCAMMFALPAMGILAGEGWNAPEGVLLPASFAKSKKAGRREYLRARVRNGQVEVFASEGSGRISGLSWADGLVELPDEAKEIAPGDPVRYFSYKDFGL